MTFFVVVRHQQLIIIVSEISIQSYWCISEYDLNKKYRHFLHIVFVHYAIFLYSYLFTYIKNKIRKKLRVINAKTTPTELLKIVNNIDLNASLLTLL